MILTMILTGRLRRSGGPCVRPRWPDNLIPSRGRNGYRPPPSVICRDRLAFLRAGREGAGSFRPPRGRLDGHTPSVIIGVTRPPEWAGRAGGHRRRCVATHETAAIPTIRRRRADRLEARRPGLFRRRDRGDEAPDLRGGRRGAGLPALAGGGATRRARRGRAAARPRRNRRPPRGRDAGRTGRRVRRAGGPADGADRAVAPGPGVGELRPRRLAQPRRRRPVAVDNDANVAALGEATRGAGVGSDPVFYATLGSGAGGGLISRGDIYHGAPPGEAEFGHLRLDRDTTVESRCSGWAVDDRIRRAKNQGARPPGLRHRRHARRRIETPRGRPGQGRPQRPTPARRSGGRPGPGPVARRPPVPPAVDPPRRRPVARRRAATGGSGAGTAAAGNGGVRVPRRKTGGPGGRRRAGRCAGTGEEDGGPVDDRTAGQTLVGAPLART